MGGRSKQQAGIHQQDHRCSAANHNGRQSDPPEAFKRKPLARDIRQQEQTCHAEPYRGDIPWREARAHTDARHDNESGPDAHGSDAVECAPDVFGSRWILHAVAL